MLGESRVSELRSGHSKDVIFNGSGSRAAAGRASVELVFDNSDGALKGMWGGFSEISVQRTITSDGSSNLSINGQPVRKRDVQDLFSGTGLGPRAYAIVGQGSIKNIIEARPEELRFFVEELLVYQSTEHAGERRKVASEIVRQIFYGLMTLFKNWTSKLKL